MHINNSWTPLTALLFHSVYRGKNQKLPRKQTVACLSSYYNQSQQPRCGELRELTYVLGHIHCPLSLLGLALHCSTWVLTEHWAPLSLRHVSVVSWDPNHTFYPAEIPTNFHEIFKKTKTFINVTGLAPVCAFTCANGNRQNWNPRCIFLQVTIKWGVCKEANFPRELCSPVSHAELRSQPPHISSSLPS